MKRRDFIKSTAVATAGLSFTGCSSASKTHILSISWDDGFKKSFHQTADIFEKYNLKACLNVIASAHLPNYGSPNSYHSDKVGDFKDWNELKKRGHEIMPHSWAHQNLAKMPLGEAQKYIDKCLEYFSGHLDNFKMEEAVYNYAFNASTIELDEYLLTKVKAIRTGGWHILGQKMENPFPSASSSMRLGCWSFGPDNADGWTEKTINDFLETKGGWLILNLHGLDNEGWGPVGSRFLDNLLQRLIEIDYLEILPVGEVLTKYN